MSNMSPVNAAKLPIFPERHLINYQDTFAYLKVHYSNTVEHPES